MIRGRVLSVQGDPVAHDAQSAMPHDGVAPHVTSINRREFNRWTFVRHFRINADGMKNTALTAVTGMFLVMNRQFGNGRLSRRLGLQHHHQAIDKSTPRKQLLSPALTS